MDKQSLTLFIKQIHSVLSYNNLRRDVMKRKTVTKCKKNVLCYRKWCYVTVIINYSLRYYVKVYIDF